MFTESLTSNRCPALIGYVEHSISFNLNSTDPPWFGARGTKVTTVTVTSLLPKSSESNKINGFTIGQVPNRRWDQGHS